MVAEDAVLPLEGADTQTLEETRKFNQGLEHMLAGEPSIEELGAAETRRRRRAGEAAVSPAPVFLPRARDLDIDGRAGPIRLRVIAPEREPTGMFLHLHGGGWTIGGADLQDPMLAELAAETGLCAVSADFRLAPEYPYPAGPDDCEDAALWLLEHGPAVTGAPARFAIGGDSSGAHLAVLTLLRLRDRHAIVSAFAAATLAFGVYDLSMTPSQLRWGTRNLVISTPILRFFAECFLPGAGAERLRDPEISPLYADLTGLAPALFTVGTNDPLLDDTLFMHARWLAAGNRAELRLWAEASHLFTFFPVAAGRQARRRQYDFLSGVGEGGAGATPLS
jgi:acetyl esterase/lipase